MNTSLLILSIYSSHSGLPLWRSCCCYIKYIAGNIKFAALKQKVLGAMAALVCCCAAAHTHTHTTEHSNTAYAQQPASRPCICLSALSRHLIWARRGSITLLNWTRSSLSRTVFYTCTIRARFTILVGLRAAPPFLHFAQVLYYPAPVCGIKWKNKAVRFSNELLAAAKFLARLHYTLCAARGEVRLDFSTRWKFRSRSARTPRINV